METKVLLRLIRDDIELLEEITASFDTEEEISSEEVGVALAKARSLVAEFEMLHSKVSVREPFPEFESSFKSDSEEEITITDKETDMPGQDSELIDLQEDEVLVSQIGGSIPEGADDKSVAEKESFIDEKLEIEPKSAKIPEPAMQGELFEEQEQSEKRTLGETLGVKQPMIHDFLAKDHHEIGFEDIPLKSMRDGIGINDRFLYIRELFGNETEKFDETIIALDGFSRIEEAVAYLKQNFKWSKSDAGEKFLNLVKRRFRN